MSTEERKKGGFDPMTVKSRSGSGYPSPFDASCKGRVKRALGDAAGLTVFGVNIIHLPSGEWSSQRHWHTRQDEFIYVIEGELTLITDDGEQTLTPGMTAGFPAGEADGHHLVNKSKADAAYLEIGDRMLGDAVEYPDIDMRAEPMEGERVNYRMVHENGTPYPGNE